MKTESVQPSRMTIGIFCYRHPSFMMRQDASMGRFDAISRFPAAVVRTMPPTVTGISKFCPKIKGIVACCMIDKNLIEIYKFFTQILDFTYSNQITGKSLSEALIFASINTQYDNRLFMKLL